METIVRNHGASIISVDVNHVIIEKTGTKEETHELYLALKPYEILEFVHSGRVAISKSIRKTEAFINELENSDSNKLAIKEF